MLNMPHELEINVWRLVKVNLNFFCYGKHYHCQDQTRNKENGRWAPQIDAVLLSKRVQRYLLLKVCIGRQTICRKQQHFLTK